MSTTGATVITLIDTIAESSVLGGILQHGFDVYVDVKEIISVECFTYDYNKAIYRCIEHIFRDDTSAKIDVPLLYSAGKSLGIDALLQKKECMTHLASIKKLPTEKETTVVLGAKIRKLQISRDLRLQLASADKKLTEVTGDEPLSDIISNVEDTIFDFTNSLVDSGSNNPELIGEGIHDFIQHMIDNPTTNMGIPSGFGKWDHAIGGGLRKGAIHLIGGRMKSGKTILADTIAMHVAKTQNIPVLNVDTEVRARLHRLLLLSMYSGVPLTKILNGQFAQSTEEIYKIKQAGHEIEGVPYKHVYVGGYDWSACASLIRRWLIRDVGVDENGVFKPCLLVYDYIKIMAQEHIGKNLQEYQALGFLLTEMHNFVTKHDIPMLTFVQLNRDGITKEATDAVGGSDRILQLVSDFSIYKTKEDEEMATDGQHEGSRKLIPIISRYGGCLEDPKDYISMRLDKRTLKVVEGRLASEIQKSGNSARDEFIDEEKEEAKFNSGRVALLQQDSNEEH
jgi:replicative DNA helicase